jgi:DNA polymerase-2
MIHADFGGLVYQPTVGLHSNVGAIDFVSMYPAVMVRCNISPEKQSLSLSDPLPEDPGLVPQTLTPLLKKRVLLKQRIPQLPAWDPHRKWYKARAAAQKWLLVVCFGYLGYKNARFGLIGSHEAVTAGGREALLRAKETAEDAGFEILHMYVDGLWIQHKDYTRPEDFQPLLEEITYRTGLPIALDGIYRWVAFLPSRGDSRVPVPNRYFGVFQDGSIKVRGLEARRHDTPAWVVATQMALIEYFAQAPDADLLPDYLPGAVVLLRQALRRLRAGQVSLEDLLVAQRLTRLPEKYTNPSPAARAAFQLQAAGKDPQPGQRIRFLHVYGKPDVWAWDRPEPVDARRIDLHIYRKLMLRAAADVFQPFGVDAKSLMLLLEGNVSVLPLSTQWEINTHRKPSWNVPRGAPAAGVPFDIRIHLPAELRVAQR